MTRAAQIRSWCREFIGRAGWCYLIDFARLCQLRIVKWKKLDRFLIKIKVWDILVRHGKGEFAIYKDTDNRVKIFRLIN